MRKLHVGRMGVVHCGSFFRHTELTLGEISSILYMTEICHVQASVRKYLDCLYPSRMPSEQIPDLRLNVARKPKGF
jgi:hypothetical protein